MRKIECIILPFKLAAVKKALRRIGVRNMRVNREFGRDRGRTELYRVNGSPMELHRVNRYPMEVDPKLKVEITVAEEDVDRVVDAIKQAVAADKTV